MEKVNKRKFTLYNDSNGELIAEFNALKELCTFLGRTRLSVEGSVWRIQNNQLNRIKSITGQYYKLVIKK